MLSVMDTLAPLKQAIEKAGSEAKLGALTGYSQVAINKAKRRGRASPEMAVAIDTAFRGEISKVSLRPDIFGKGEAA